MFTFNLFHTVLAQDWCSYVSCSLLLITRWCLFLCKLKHVMAQILSFVGNGCICCVYQFNKFNQESQQDASCRYWGWCKERMEEWKVLWERDHKYAIKFLRGREGLFVMYRCVNIYYHKLCAEKNYYAALLLTSVSL